MSGTGCICLWISLSLVWQKWYKSPIQHATWRVFVYSLPHFQVICTNWLQGEPGNNASVCAQNSFVVYRSTPMASFHSNLHSLQLLLTCFHYLPIFHWLLLSGVTWTLQDLGTYSTEKHPMPPYSKEPRINCRDCFNPLPTSLQPHCLLQHGTEWQSLSQSLLWESLRYMCLLTWLLISTHYGTTGQL